MIRHQSFRFVFSALTVLTAGCAPSPAASPNQVPTATPSAPPTPSSTTVEPRCSVPLTPAQKLVAEGDAELGKSRQQAIERYLEARKVDPSDHRTLRKLALTYLADGKPGDAEAAAREALALDPKNADYASLLGLSLQQMARQNLRSYGDAKAAFAHCIELDPAAASCYTGMADALLWTDDEHGALEQYTEAVRRDPTRLSHVLPLADLYLRLEHASEAEAILAAALARAKPSDPYLYGGHMLLAQAYQTRGALSDQVRELEAAKRVATGIDATYILYALGTTYALLTPPRAPEAVRDLQAFAAKACHGTKAKVFATECETTSTLFGKLHGTQPAPEEAAPKPVAEAPTGNGSADEECGGPPKPYKPRTPYAGAAVSLPAVPRVQVRPWKVGDVYTVSGLQHHLRSRVHSSEVNGKTVTVVGYVVKTNYDDAPICAVHETGKGDPPDCRAPMPTFFIADEKGSTEPPIQVMGWASNWAQIYTLVTALHAAPKGQEDHVQLMDEFWGMNLPNPVPAVGAKLKIRAKYGVTFTKASGGLATNPRYGILTTGTVDTLERAPKQARLPGMK